MPVELKHPGVYIEEVPSGVRPIVGVSTSITAFIGRARRGPVPSTAAVPPTMPVTVRSMPEFDRVFGGLWAESRMSFAVRQFFENGGNQALIVRVARGALTAFKPFPAGGGNPLRLEASSPGAWGNNLTVALAPEAAPATGFSLLVRDPAPIGSGAEESFRNLSVNEADARFVGAVLKDQSRLLRLAPKNVAAYPNQNPSATPAPPAAPSTLATGADGVAIQDADVTAGLSSLDRVDFNLLCLPPLTDQADLNVATYATAATYCENRRAFLILDSPAGKTQAGDATAFLGQLNFHSTNAALYFPRFLAANPLKDNQIEEFAPCGAVAGIYARTDSQRGVWKAPAGLEAGVRGTAGASFSLTDGENGDINPVGINAVRNMGIAGTVLWGARTLDGADVLASQWKYTPVRRTALFIEESLFRGTQWVVFEPNDEPLWSQIRLNIGAFMNRLFRQGAFQGTTPAQAYFVKCDKETTTQDDIDRGVVNILVGFAPLKPAEFVVIRIQQISGQSPA